MRTTIVKEPDGKYTIRGKRTRRDEKRGTQEQHVPRDQLSAALDKLQKEMRGDR